MIQFSGSANTTFKSLNSIVPCNVNRKKDFLLFVTYIFRKKKYISTREVEFFDKLTLSKRMNCVWVSLDG